MKPFFVYVLRCSDDSYYVGHTDDLAHRVALHQAGEVAGYTQQRRPVQLVWSQETASRLEALSAERQIKGWRRAKKEALMAGNWDLVSLLAKGRDGRLAAPAVRAEPVGGPPRASTSSARTEQGGSPVRPSPPTPPPVRPELVEGPVAGAPGASTSSARTERGGSQTPPPTPWVESILGPPGPAQRRAIAKTITLLESTRPADRAPADTTLDTLLPHAGRSFRLGLSGVPGVGKSTFIEALGLQLIARGHRVAVLAIDPSSSLSGGSILGDKTRMERLSTSDSAFIRPSPSSGTLGGVAEKTREAMLVFEAAGYDLIIVETVGVGQNETAVAGMTDCFVLMQLPNAGDDLQALKKGVTELADLVVINKADLDADAATRARAQITSALRLLGLHGNPAHDPSRWSPRVIQLSALHAAGLDEFWACLTEFRTLQTGSGRFHTRRQQQNEAWMWERIQAGLTQRFRAHPAVREHLGTLTQQVRQGLVPASVAARRLLDGLDRQ